MVRAPRAGRTEATAVSRRCRFGLLRHGRHWKDDAREIRTTCDKRADLHSKAPGEKKEDGREEEEILTDVVTVHLGIGPSP